LPGKSFAAALRRVKLNKRFQVSGFRCQQTAQQCGFMKLDFKFVWERFPTAIKIDSIPLFDVRCWTSDVQRSLVCLIDQTGRLRPAAALTPET